MANICLKIRAIKTKTHINQAHKHNNTAEAKMLIDAFEGSKKRFSQDVSKRIQTLREDGKLDRKFSNNEIELAEIIFTGSPEWFRNKLELPEGWRNLDDKQKQKLWEKHKADPKKIEEFQKVALKMLKEQLPAEALINVTLHTHETSPHIHALILPMTKPENGKPSRLSYDRIFGQAKGRKVQDGFEQWQDLAGQYFAKTGLERGQRGSISIYKAPKIWNEETAEAKKKASKEADQLKVLMRRKTLIEQYGHKSKSILNSKEENAKIAQAQSFLAKGITAQRLENEIAQRFYDKATKAYTEQNANEHLRAEKKKFGELNERRKTNEDFSKMYEKAKKKDPEQAEKALQKLKDLSTPAVQPKLAVSPGPDLKALARPAPRIATTYEASQNHQPQQNAQETPSEASASEAVGEAEPQLSKSWDKMTASEKMAHLKAVEAWKKREEQRRERLAKMKPKP